MRTFTKHADFEVATALAQFDVACSRDVDYAYVANQIIGHFDHKAQRGIIAAAPDEYQSYCEKGKRI